MILAEREAQIIRIQSQDSPPELLAALEATLKREVMMVTKSIIETTLVEELETERQTKTGPQPRRSGYFSRVLDTEYGRIEQFQVPKLRWGNKEREWQILKRYQRGLDSLLNFTLCLYVMGLSLRDLQEALYPILGSVLSVSTINRITLNAQTHMDEHRQSPISQTPAILIVDGVWVDIQYAQDEVKIDRAGHERQVRHAEDRVILSAIAVWPDGSYHILHYEIAMQEDTQSWSDFFNHLIERGLDPKTVELVVSDGSSGLPAAMAKVLPHAKQQRCITHKVRRMKKYLSYQQLPQQNELDQVLTDSDAKKQRCFEIQNDAYEIYKSTSYQEAQARLALFVDKWTEIESKAVSTFQRDIELTFNFYHFAAELHPRIRTSNLLERLFEEFRRKSDEVGAFPNEKSCLTLFFLVVQRDHAKHNRSMVAKTS